MESRSFFFVAQSPFHQPAEGRFHHTWLSWGWNFPQSVLFGPAIVKHNQMSKTFGFLSPSVFFIHWMGSSHVEARFLQKAGVTVLLHLVLHPTAGCRLNPLPLYKWHVQQRTPNPVKKGIKIINTSRWSNMLDPQSISRNLVDGTKFKCSMFFFKKVFVWWDGKNRCQLKHNPHVIQPP